MDSPIRVGTILDLALDNDSGQVTGVGLGEYFGVSDHNYKF